ncbi:MAG: amidophosphoribosyltransferase [Candidatus Omnitrophica bacterium]|nr:amidophosphoribosyltransferase [Candidatus Omnitrophota bacterium]
MSGIFGVVSQGDCRSELFFGTDYHSHLGTEFAGLAVWNKTLIRKIHNISDSQFKSKFFCEYENMPGNKGIGVISSKDEQPIFVKSKFGPFAIVTNGFIDNAQQLTELLYQQGQSFGEVADGSVNHTELVAKLILGGKDIVDGIQLMFRKIQGSCSLLILAEEGIYAARDRYGYFPLVIGEKKGSLAVTTETAAFHNLGYKIKRYLAPAEIILLTAEGIKVKQKGNGVNQTCAFLWIYTGFPASCYEGVNTEIVRENCGRALARRETVAADLVSGIPDSGTAHALGYAMESGIPYRRILVKYTPGYGRSYTPPSQKTRDLVAKMKLIPIEEIIKGKRVIICDDSIVRGTQFKNFTITKLKQCAVKEIHLRIACPPLMFPCKFNFSTRTTQELAARKAIRALEGRDIQDVTEYVDENSSKHRAMVDWIRKDLEVTTLVYQRLNDMVEAIGLPREKLCTYCWTGKTL